MDFAGKFTYLASEENDDDMEEVEVELDEGTSCVALHHLHQRAFRCQPAHLVVFYLFCTASATYLVTVKSTARPNSIFSPLWNFPGVLLCMPTLLTISGRFLSICPFAMQSCE